MTWPLVLLFLSSSTAKASRYVFGKLCVDDVATEEFEIIVTASNIRPQHGHRWIWRS
jgi:hypothetical protein